jgi:hypothetical protein
MSYFYCPVCAQRVKGIHGRTPRHGFSIQRGFTRVGFENLSGHYGDPPIGTPKGNQIAELAAKENDARATELGRIQITDDDIIKSVVEKKSKTVRWQANGHICYEKELRDFYANFAAHFSAGDRKATAEYAEEKADLIKSRDELVGYYRRLALKLRDLIASETLIVD